MKYLIIISLLMLAACGTVEERTSTGNSAYNSGNYDAALYAYQEAQVAAPDRAEPYYNAASAYIGDNELNRAIDALNQALQTADTDLSIQAYYNLGLAYYELGMYAESIEVYQAGLRLDPENEDIRYNLEIVQLWYVDPTPTALEQQTQPEQNQTDPNATPTDNPGGFDDPTPTPPPLEFDPTATPSSGESSGSGQDSTTPIPQSEGDMTVEQAERLLEQIQQDQQALREFIEEAGGEGQTSEKDW